MQQHMTLLNWHALYVKHNCLILNYYKKNSNISVSVFYFYFKKAASSFLYHINPFTWKPVAFEIYWVYVTLSGQEFQAAELFPPYIHTSSG